MLLAHQTAAAAIVAALAALATLTATASDASAALLQRAPTTFAATDRLADILRHLSTRVDGILIDWLTVDDPGPSQRVDSCGRRLRRSALLATRTSAAGAFGW
jgi:hypothetical protein